MEAKRFKRSREKRFYGGRAAVRTWLYFYPSAGVYPVLGPPWKRAPKGYDLRHWHGARRHPSQRWSLKQNDNRKADDDFSWRKHGPRVRVPLRSNRHRRAQMTSSQRAAAIRRSATGPRRVPMTSSPRAAEPAVMAEVKVKPEVPDPVDIESRCAGRALAPAPCSWERLRGPGEAGSGGARCVAVENSLKMKWSSSAVRKSWGRVSMRWRGVFVGSGAGRCVSSLVVAEKRFVLTSSWAVFFLPFRPGSDNLSRDWFEAQQSLVPKLLLSSPRIIELCHQFPHGITDQVIQNDMPHMEAQQRAMAINRLLSMVGCSPLPRFASAWGSLDVNGLHGSTQPGRARKFILDLVPFAIIGSFHGLILVLITSCDHHDYL